MTEPIVIWGAGAIGGSLGAAFVRAGRPVIFVDTVPEHVAAIRAQGLRIDGPLVQEVVQAPACLPGELTGQYRLIFLCVKAQHTAAAAAQLAPHLAADGAVVSAQNGLNELVIAEAVGRARTIGCFVNFGADYLEPGVVHYSGRGAVVVGELDGRTTPRIEEIFALLQRFEPNAVLTGNIWGYLWGKLIYGALLFATALTNESIADALDAPEWRDTLTRLGQEVARVAAAEGVALMGFDGFIPAAFSAGAGTAALTESFDLMVAHNRRSTKSHSGIWRDLAIRKRPTEADAQLGPIVAAAARHGLRAPLTERVIAMIHEIEQGRRPLARENMDRLGAEVAA